VLTDKEKTKKNSAKNNTEITTAITACSKNELAVQLQLPFPQHQSVLPTL